MQEYFKVNIETVSPDDGYDYFFAYYDLQPYDKQSKRHLAHRVGFHDRIPTADDVAEIGYITLADKQFHKVAESRAWNFQQGSLLQWFDDERVIYNDYRNGEFCSVIKHVSTGEERVLCAPLANLSRDRKWGLSINFPRIWDFRPGYGYCNLKDRFYDEYAPANDGIFLVDIEQNTAKLIISYRDLAKTFVQKPHSERKLVVNHITFNPCASRFLFLLRDFPEKAGDRWGTMLITANRDGSDLRNLTDYTGNSHYDWKNDGEIMIYAQLPEWGIYFIDDATGVRRHLDDAQINQGDTHCLYHPDRTCFIGDGYPRGVPYRDIFLYDFETEKSCRIASIYSKDTGNTDCRCDLHNRFNPDGTLVSFDSLGEGQRCIRQFAFDKKAIMENAL
ncbi:MAG: hypothetical protein IJW70_04635 [Clostridia bacterium]|nr:hypothetical protein [Clostridia bacterium]